MTTAPQATKRPASRAPRLCALLLSAFTPLILTGCGRTTPANPQAAAPAANPDTRVEYTVRGRVTQLPGDADHPAQEFMVRHEAIPEFRASMSPDNDRMGMRSMTMAFPIAEGVSLDGIGVGTPVEMMFETTYDAETGRLKGYVVCTLSALAPDTPLELGESTTPRLP
ncbi:MAG: copper-binding protein [Phycisphaeraceae bacterium]|nr:copper-binding protein [Phycisphaeraceae bacterium]MCB9846937.1 copper-binding protein [Phycisphaeraceae bacterium]